MLYIPKYVRQESDLNYGEKVTHENYNEKLNLNTTQGDYNTEVLNALFNDEDIESTYHIPYIDNILTNQDSRITTVEGAVERIQQDMSGYTTGLVDTNTRIDNITNGTVQVGNAASADIIAGASSAGPSKYYGTDAESNVGFIDLPEFIYADEITSSAGVEGIYFIPMLNSVAENMLTADVREKLNREAVVDYEYLDNLPEIAGVTLIGDKSLSDLGIQPVGDYVTNSALNTLIAGYYTKQQTDSAIATALTGNATQSWVNTQLGNYATTSSLNDVSAKANAAAVIQVGSSFSGTPKNGDLLITL